MGLISPAGWLVHHKLFRARAVSPDHTIYPIHPPSSVSLTMWPSPLQGACSSPCSHCCTTQSHPCPHRRLQWGLGSGWREEIALLDEPSHETYDRSCPCAWLRSFPQRTLRSLVYRHLHWYACVLVGREHRSMGNPYSMSVNYIHVLQQQHDIHNKFT